jgi:hypothetical protein
MSTATKEAPATKVVIGPVRLSYPALWEPRAAEEGGKKKYSAVPLIPETDTATLAKIDAAVKAAIEIGKTSKWDGKIPPPAKLKLPLRDGTDEKPDSEEYAGMKFLTANSDNKPQVSKKVAGKTVLIEDQDEVYAGCWVYMSINFYPFSANGNKGVAAGLGNILKCKDDTPFSGRSTAEEDFAEIEIEEEEYDI